MQIIKLQREMVNKQFTGRFLIAFDSDTNEYLITSEKLHNQCCDFYRNQTIVEWKANGNELIKIREFRFNMGLCKGCPSCKRFEKTEATLPICNECRKDFLTKPNEYPLYEISDFYKDDW